MGNILATYADLFGSPLGQAYTNENCCLKCSQTPGCVSWFLETLFGGQMACSLSSSRQSNFDTIPGYNGGNL